MRVHEDQNLSFSFGSTERAASSDTQAPGAPNQAHPAQVRHVLTQHAFQVTWEPSTYAAVTHTRPMRVHASMEGKVDPPCWLRSSTSRTSRRCCLGAVLNTLCTVRRSVDQASLWKQITTLADGRNSLYCCSKHLMSGKYVHVSNEEVK